MPISTLTCPSLCLVTSRMAAWWLKKDQWKGGSLSPSPNLTPSWVGTVSEHGDGGASIPRSNWSTLAGWGARQLPLHPGYGWQGTSEWCLSMRVSQLSCLSGAVGPASVELTLPHSGFPWLSLWCSFSGLLATWIHSPDRWGMAEFGSGSKAGSLLVILVFLAPGLCVSYSHCIWGLLSLVYQGALSTPRRC